MKNVFKFLSLGMITVAFYAVGTTSILAQATLEECTPVYEKFKVERASTDPEILKTAMATGKDYLAKCSALEGQEAIRDYVTKQIPAIEKRIEVIKDKNLEARFNTGVKDKNWDDAIASGKELIAKGKPYAFDVVLTIASIGFDSAVASPPVDKHNGDAITYAKMALQQIEAGKTSEDWGVLQYSYKTKECTDGKLNATGWMNYTIGYIMDVRQKQGKDAIPYLYKATQVGCETKTFSEVYRLIGAWYIQDFKLLETRKSAKYEELQKLEAAKDPKLAEAEKEYDAIIALQKGYIERVMDSYARAYKNASADKNAKAEFKTTLLNVTKEFYGFRYNADMSGFDAWLTGLNAKPFPDPTTPVTPIVETTTATTPGTSAVPTNIATTTTVADTRPRTANTMPTSDATTTPATKAGTTTTKKAPAKKPTKKKGTR